LRKRIIRKRRGGENPQEQRQSLSSHNLYIISIIKLILVHGVDCRAGGGGFEWWNLYVDIKDFFLQDRDLPVTCVWASSLGVGGNFSI
jgi:hypothetical protein